MPSGVLPVAPGRDGQDGDDLPVSDVEQDLAGLVDLDVRLGTRDSAGRTTGHSASLPPGLRVDEAGARQPVRLLEREHGVDELPGERLPEPGYAESQPGECARETVYVGAARADREDCAR